jgi:ATP-dependent RNA helicase RhlE
VGDAISFVTPEDQSELRALERFIGRGIVRKKAEGFNYAVSAPAGEAAVPQRHQQRPQGSSSHPRSAPGGGVQHGGHGHSGQRSHGHSRRFGSR